MTDETSLVPLVERTVVFYDDELTAVLVKAGEEEQIFVPVRPMCGYLGIDWSAQRKRIVGDPVLSEEVRSVAVTATEAGGKRDMLCLPLEFLNGWLFGVSASRVKPEIRKQLIRYQKECYRVLSRAFVSRPGAEEVSPATATLLQVREMGRAIMQMAEEQIEFERRLVTTEDRLDRAAVVVSALDRRVSTIEERLSPGQPVTEEQASQISQAVKSVAMIMTKRSGSSQYGAVYGELYRKFGITSYKMLPAGRYKEAMEFLSEWHASLAADESF